MQIGVDFGTTHTTAAFRKGRRVHFIPLDPANEQPHLLRSMIYMTRAHDVTLGVTAVRDHLRQNTGRLIQLQPKKVGAIENTVARQTRTPWEPDGPIVIVHDVLIDEDVGAPGRLLQSIKTGLRDPDYRGAMIFGRFFSLPELIALILAHVKKQAEAELGTVVTAVRLGRPAKFAESAEQDALAQARLQAKQIDAVVTTGGSSLIPVFQSLLSRRFSAAQLVRSDTFGSVAAGLALQGDDRLR